MTSSTEFLHLPYLSWREKGGLDVSQASHFDNTAMTEYSRGLETTLATLEVFQSEILLYFSVEPLLRNHSGGALISGLSVASLKPREALRIIDW